jgi:hypothetical protein
LQYLLNRLQDPVLALSSVLDIEVQELLQLRGLMVIDEGRSRWPSIYDKAIACFLEAGFFVCGTDERNYEVLDGREELRIST